MLSTWHNLPPCARHGLDGGQLDQDRHTMRAFEKLGRTCKAHWPRPEQLDNRGTPVNRPKHKGLPSDMMA